MTMTKTANPAHRAANTQTPVPTTREIDLPDHFGAVLAELSELKHARTEIEKREKILKAEVLAALPPRERGVKFVVRVGGVIRANVNRIVRQGNDRKALAEAFPEAYSATLTETEYDSLNPA